MLRLIFINVYQLQHGSQKERNNNGHSHHAGASELDSPRPFTVIASMEVHACWYQGSNQGLAHRARERGINKILFW